MTIDAIPSGAPSLSSTQLEQMATNLINGTQPTPPSGGGDSSQGASPSGPSLTNTAQLLGVSQSQLSSDLQSGTTLSELAEENGVSSSELLSSVESDLTADGTGPSSSSSTASSNLSALSDATGVNSSVLLTQLSSGTDLSNLLEAPGQTGYGSTVAGTLDGGVAVDEYA